MNRQLRARLRDLRVYWAARPVVFALLSALGGRPVGRVGRRILVQSADGVRHVLTKLPLDRTAPGTTGGEVTRQGGSGDAWFDGDGARHRGTRRPLAARLGRAGVAELADGWRATFAAAAAAVEAGERVELVGVARVVSGRVAAELLGLDLTDAECAELAVAAGRAAAASVRGHLRPGAVPADPDAPLRTVLGRDAPSPDIVLAVATTNTLVAALPRAVAWVADAGLWPVAGEAERRPVLVDELLRVLVPSPLLPRVAAAAGEVSGCPVAVGDQLLLYLRPALRASRPPDVGSPAPPLVSSLVFGAGPHACPGAGLTRQLLADCLAAFAPHAPTVRRARADRRTALPAWRELWVGR